MVINLEGKIEGPVTILGELDLATDWQEGAGGRSDVGSLALDDNGFRRDGLGLLCCADEAGAKDFEDISEFFSGDEA